MASSRCSGKADAEPTLSLTDAVLKDQSLPAVGSDLGAVVRLVGQICQPNTGRASTEGYPLTRLVIT